MMKIALTRQFLQRYNSLSQIDRKLCDAALAARPNAFGHPHRHAGLGVRALRRGLYECRPSQSVRVGFTRHGDTLLLHTVGNHETIRTWLRANS